MNINDAGTVGSLAGIPLCFLLIILSNDADTKSRS